MSVTLLACGILLAGAGLVAAGLGISLSDLPIGNTLLVVGAIGLVGGLQLVGLSSAVADLALLRKGMATRPGSGARPERAAEPAAPARQTAEPAPPEVRLPEPRPPVAAPGVDVSASAIERLRSSIPRPERAVPVAEDVPLSPNGNHSAPQHDPVPHAPAARPASGGAAVETLKEPRLDFLFRQRQARPAAPENFDSMWPKRPTRSDPQAVPRVEVAPATAGAEPPAAELPAREEPMPEMAAPPPNFEPAVAAPVPEPARSVAILKSGVVDGMAYTLYADGSIEAQLPQGMVRFGSIAELRAHIENGS
jgi:hypothetical protein